MNVEERVLLEALAREPVRRTARLAPVPVGLVSEPAIQGLAPLEREALSLLLRYPALTAEMPSDEPLPFRDATTNALVDAWRERVAGGQATAADLEALIGNLDPATAGLARDLLVYLAGNGAHLDAADARAQLRTCLLRLRAQRIEEAIHDGQLLLAEAQREGDESQLDALKQQINQLGHEKADLNKAMESPAQAVGARRN